MSRKIFNKEQEDYIRSIAKGIGNKEITEAVNKKFGLNITQTQMKSFKKNHKISSGLTGYSPKGFTPSNKGKKMSPQRYEKCKATMFRKGHMPSNHRPVGSERINADGYIEIKVAEPNTWRLKHRVLWEEKNGKIEKGLKLIFLDGNKQNVSIDNLEILTSAEILLLNQQKIEAVSKEIMESRIALAKLEIKARERRKE